MERKDIPEQLKWKIADVYASDEAWDADYQWLEDTYGNYDFSVFQGKLGDKQTLLQFFALPTWGFRHA